jgi:hypothetical protein
VQYLTKLNEYITPSISTTTSLSRETYHIERGGGGDVSLLSCESLPSQRRTIPVIHMIIGLQETLLLQNE